VAAVLKLPLGQVGCRGNLLRDEGAKLFALFGGVALS